VRSWRLWTKPRRVVGYVLGVELLTVALSAWAGATHTVTRSDLTHFAVIVGIALLASEAARHVERMRRHLADTPHVNLSSVWMVPAALLTAPGLTVVVVAVLYGHMWLRIWRPISGRYPHRVVFSASTVVLSCLATRGVADLAPSGHILDDLSARGLMWIVLAIVVHFAVNTGLVAIAIALEQSDRSPSRLLGSWHDNSIEFATLSMGALTAVLLTWRPTLVVLILLPLHVLHRSVLIRQLEHAATTDEKTGVLNAASWQAMAAKELGRAARHGLELGVLLVDLDHFKWVNDNYGHLVGDQVLRAVADAMRDELREYDLCGRLGGEEFVVLLPETGLTDSIAIGNRICARIRALPVEPGDSTSENGRLSASIGVAAYPDAGAELDEILLAADNAMFAAKDSGRDQVRAVMPSERRSP
jgi:diguanylate cyclase (GGDEF)-like protein